MNDWVLAYDGVDPAEEGLRETLLTLGNGYLATRGAAPESEADATHYPGTYVAGCWNRLRDEVDGQVVENESMVNLPNWLPLTIAVGDGDWLDLAATEVLSHRQELDLRRGVLTRWLEVRDAAGRRTRVSQRRLVSMADAHLAALETTVTAENWSGPLRIRSGLDGTVVNAGVGRYRDLGARHLLPVSQARVCADTTRLVVQTSQSLVRIAVGARTRVFGHDPTGEVARTLRTEPGLVEELIALDVVAGEPVTVEKVAAVHTGRDPAVGEPTEAVESALAAAEGFEGLLERHVLAWSHLWERFDTRLGGGRARDLRVRLALRLDIFHLLQTLSVHTSQADAGVPARGLHGEAYRGHVFWDELFVLPVLTVRAPHLTRSLLGYRYRRLPAARAAARADGLVGALFPWQSGSDGREASQRVHLNPLSGRWLPDVSHLQRHAGLAVAFTAWHYWEVTGDRRYLEAQGAEIILDVARYWSALAAADHARDRFVIRGVMGPDEFHTAITFVYALLSTPASHAGGRSSRGGCSCRSTTE